jgi:hypothetical protein
MKHLRDALRIASVVIGLTVPVTPAFADQGSSPSSQLPSLTAQWW